MMIKLTFLIQPFHLIIEKRSLVQPGTEYYLLLLEGRIALEVKTKVSDASKQKNRKNGLQ
ncbi:hypothetical protein [Alteribacillus sp. YIM 98480]|uniref:hypothetical protein n=1 Tax=Alteribacillus sp. YIM 98480 TaxID=2606599 RepID=UPI001E42DD21|nr:hypothetical protein [Alteribacillus sp. YIM 98480]